MQTSNAIRQERYPVELRVRMVWEQHVYECLTEDVSLGGMFVRTEARPPVGQLVRLHVELPGEQSATRMHAAVANYGFGDTPGPLGLGLKFYGIAEGDRETWQGYVQDLYEQSRRMSAVQVPALGMVGDQAGRATVLEMRVPTHKHLWRMYAADLELSGTFIETNRTLHSGEPVYLAVVHPTTGRVFEIDAVVRRVVQEGPLVGVVVGFTTMDQGRRHAFRDFIGDEGAAANTNSVLQSAVAAVCGTASTGRA